MYTNKGSLKDLNNPFFFTLKLKKGIKMTSGNELILSEYRVLKF